MMANCSYVTLFFLYAIFNISRYFLIGQFTADVNSNTADDVVKFQQYACDCYFVSKSPQKYGIDTNVRFELAHAIPPCTSCYYCEDYFHGSANASFNTTGLCPVGDYKDTAERFSFGSLNHWNHVTDCSRKISLSSMIFWTKNYNVYKSWALGVSILYCILLLISVAVIGINWYKVSKATENSDRGLLLIINHQDADNSDKRNNKSLAKKIDYVLKTVYLYNVLISELLLYLLYKPLQYHHTHLTVGVDNKPIVCDISSIPMKTEDWLGIMAFASYIVIGCRIIYSVFYESMIYKWFKNRCGINYSDNTVSKHLNCLISTRLSVTVSECRNKCHFSKHISCRNFVMVTKIVFLAFAITAFVMLYEGVTKTKTDQLNPKVITVLILLPLSFIDNPWLWKTCFANCSSRHFNKLKRKMSSLRELSLTINNSSNTDRQNIEEEMYDENEIDRRDDNVNISNKIMGILQKTMKRHSSQHPDDIITRFANGDNDASRVSNNGTEQHDQDEKKENDNNNNNNNNSNNNNNGFNGNSGDDGKNNDNNNNRNHKNNSNDEENDEKEIDRLITLLNQMQNIDDNTLCITLNTFSPNIFVKLSRGIQDLNTQIKRIAISLPHSSILSIENVISNATTNGYSTDEMTALKYSSASASDMDEETKSNSNIKSKRKKKKKLLRKQKNINETQPNNTTCHTFTPSVSITPYLVRKIIPITIQEEFSSDSDLWDYMNITCAMQFTDCNTHQETHIKVMNLGFHHQNNNHNLYCVIKLYNNSRWKMEDELFTKSDIINEYNITEFPIPSRTQNQFICRLNHQAVIVSIMEEKETRQILIKNTKWTKINVYNKTNNKRRVTFSITKLKFISDLEQNAFSASNLIPIILFYNGGYRVEYIWIVTINGNNLSVNIGISMIYNVAKNKIEITGIHVDKMDIIKQCKWISLYNNNKIEDCLKTFTSSIDQFAIGNPDTADNKIRNLTKTNEELRDKIRQYEELIQTQNVYTV